MVAEEVKESIAASGLAINLKIQFPVLQNASSSFHDVAFQIKPDIK